MENLDVARVLGEAADLLEIRGTNPFRVRAYRNAARTVRSLTRPVREMVEAGEDLTELPGIGREMAAHIRELVETGRLSVLDEVAREVPATLVDLVRLDGVGPKRARKLWEALGVTSVDALREALEAGRVEALEGFGKRSAAKIARAIEDFRSRQGRFLLSDADALVAPLVAHLREAPGVEAVEVAGSYRRRRETVGDLDVLVLCEGDRTSVMERFTGYPGAERVEAAGETRGRIVLHSGLPVDVRIVSRGSYGAALHYFSGSKEHNVALRTLGVRQGLRINEYGVFRIPPGLDPEKASPEELVRVGGETEEEVFGAVGLPWIPPVLREGRGEIEAAREGRLPELVGLEEIRGDLQMHSTWSDGKASIREMAEACRVRGYEYMALTDHSRAMTVAGGLGPEEVEAQWEEIERVRREVPGIEILRSLEVDILKDGSLDMPGEILRELDLVVVSVHTHMTMERSEMTRRIVRAISHPEVDVLAHPTGRLLTRRSPYEVDLEEVLRAAAEMDVAVELNANPQRLDLPDVHLRRAKELGVKVVISTDAHSVADLEYMRYGVEQAGRGWLEPHDVLNTRSLGELRAWLGRRG